MRLGHRHTYTHLYDILLRTSSMLSLKSFYVKILLNYCSKEKVNTNIDPFVFPHEQF